MYYEYQGPAHGGKNAILTLVRGMKMGVGAWEQSLARRRSVVHKYPCKAQQGSGLVAMQAQFSRDCCRCGSHEYSRSVITYNDIPKYRT